MERDSTMTDYPLRRIKDVNKIDEFHANCKEWQDFSNHFMSCQVCQLARAFSKTGEESMEHRCETEKILRKKYEIVCDEFVKANDPEYKGAE